VLLKSVDSPLDMPHVEHPVEHPVVPSPSSSGPTTLTCKQRPSHRPPIKQGILSFSIIIAATSLLLFAAGLVTTPHQAQATAPLPLITALQHVPFGLTPLRQLLVCLPGCLATLILAAAFSTATVLAPTWYRRGGRGQLLAAARLLPKAVTLLQLLLLPAIALEQLHSTWLHHTVVVGVKGLPAVIIWPLLFPVSTHHARACHVRMVHSRCGDTLPWQLQQYAFTPCLRHVVWALPLP
jgi:hypothetical protein